MLVRIVTQLASNAQPKATKRPDPYLARPNKTSRILRHKRFEACSLEVFVRDETSVCDSVAEGHSFVPVTEEVVANGAPDSICAHYDICLVRGPI